MHIVFAYIRAQISALYTHIRRVYFLFFAICIASTAYASTYISPVDTVSIPNNIHIQAENVSVVYTAGTGISVDITTNNTIDGKSITRVWYTLSLVDNVYPDSISLLQSRIYISPHLPVGIHTVMYRMCDMYTRCDLGQVRIVANPPPYTSTRIAYSQTLSSAPPSIYAGTDTIVHTVGKISRKNILKNDTIDGERVRIGQVNILSETTDGVYIDEYGYIVVPAAYSGKMVYRYSICIADMPTVCSLGRVNIGK